MLIFFPISGVAYAVDSANRTTGVTYADYFVLNIHHRFTKEEGNKTRINVIAEVIWEKPCLFKSKIETETLSGIKKYYEIFEKELQTEKTLNAGE